MAYDLLIKNGRVVDGSGEPAFAADVAVQDGKIVGVGKYAGAAAKRTIDAAGRVVAPGFIDHHTHFDPQAVWDPYCGSWVHNGHTTVVVGQCGQVIAPVRPGDSEWYLEFFSDAEQIPLPVLKAGVDVTWESVGDYLNALGKKRGINVGTLVGHSGIRRYVMGEAASERQATPEEMAAMQRLIREAMHDGALGFSTAPKDRGDPAGVGDDAERWALASVLGELGTGVFQVAGGAPGGTKQTRAGRPRAGGAYRAAVDLQLDVAIRSPTPMSGSSICAGSRTGSRAARAATARASRPSPARSLTCSAASMCRRTRTSRIPKASSAACRPGTRSWPCPIRNACARSATPNCARRLSAEAVEGTVAQEGGMTDRRGRARGFFNRRWDLVEVFMTTKGQNRHLEGKSVEQIAKEQNKGIMDAFLDLSLDEDLNTCFQAIDRNKDPKAQKHILGSQYTVIGTSDGGGRPHTADRHETSTNLLGHWVREEQVMTLEEAVYRLTGKTALMHDITDRGFIAAGKVADITIFDPDTIASKPREPVATLPAGGVQVKREAVGIDYVVVNGSVLLDKGELTDALPGQIIRGPLYQGARA